MQPQKANPYRSPHAALGSCPESSRFHFIYALTLAQLGIHGFHLWLSHRERLRAISEPGIWTGLASATLLLSAMLACFMLSWCLVGRRGERLPILMWPWLLTVGYMGIRFLVEFLNFMV